MRRIQIYIEEPVDDALEREARRRGISKAAVIRDAVARDLDLSEPGSLDPWAAMAGSVDGRAHEDDLDIDEVVYGRKA